MIIKEINNVDVPFIKEFVNSLYVNYPQIQSTKIIQIRPEDTSYTVSKHFASTAYVLVGKRHHCVDEIVEGEIIRLPMMTMSEMFLVDFHNVEKTIMQSKNVFDLIVVFKKDINDITRDLVGITLITKLK